MNYCTLMPGETLEVSKNPLRTQHKERQMISIEDDFQPVVYHDEYLLTISISVEAL
jgi:hypothetical protein